MLIGLTGDIGAGKDTVADILVREGFRHLAFKDPIRDALEGIFGVDPGIFSDRVLKEKPHAQLFGKTPRELLISLGTDWGRSMVHPDIWTQLVERKVKESADADVVVSDIRFDNEAEMIKRLGGFVFKIVRPANPFGSVTKNRVTEAGIDPDYIDLLIVNSGGLSELRRKIIIIKEMYGS